jgi:hypothetical protein
VLAKVALVVLGVLAPLFALELVLRLAGPILPGEYQTAAFTTTSPVVGRRNKPNTQGWKQTAEFTTFVQVNSKGLRGPEVDYVKPPGTFRILALGDSFTFALQVNEQETFEAKLAELLNQAPAGQRVEVLNAGVDGWGTANEYEWLVSEGYRYQPDLVLLMFFVGNDPGDNADLLASPDDVDRLRIGQERSGQLEDFREALRRRSVAVNIFEQGVLAKIATGSPTGLPDDDVELDVQQQMDAAQRLLGATPERPLTSFSSARKVRGWAITSPLLGRLRDFSEAIGAKLVVVEIPTADQVLARDETTTPLSVLTSREGLPLIQLLGPFRAQSKRIRERLYFQENRHWTRDGHDVTATVIAAALRELGLVPSQEATLTGESLGVNSP